jgi:integrase
VEIYGLTDDRIQQLKIRKTITGITLCELCAVYLSDYYERQKITSYVALKALIKNHIFKHISSRTLVTDINYSIVHKFREDIQNDDIKNKNNIIAYFKSIFKFANEYYHYRSLAVFRLNNFRREMGNKNYKPYDIYTYKDFKKFTRKVIDPFELSLYYCLYYFGLRIGEIRGLQWQDIDKDILYIRRAATPSADEQRTIMIDVKSASSFRYFRIPPFILKEFNLLKMFSNSKTFVFGNTETNPNYPMSESSIRRKLQERAKKQKMRYLHPHAWRHSCASFLVNELHCDIYQVKEWLGHSDIVITSKIYIQLFPERKDEITNQINQLNLKK